MKIYLYIICISYDCTRLCLASISQSSSFVSRLFLMFVSGRANSRFFFFFSVSGLKSLCYGIKSVRPALSRVHAFVQGASGPFAFYFFIYTSPRHSQWAEKCCFPSKQQYRDSQSWILPWPQLYMFLLKYNIHCTRNRDNSLTHVGP